MSRYSIAVDPEMSEEEHETLLDGLISAGERYAPPRGYELLSLALRDERGKLRGGLLGSTLWNWLQVEILWVEESLRGSGLGRELLRAAEAEAIRIGCHSARLDTFDFEARDFYEKEGYQIYGQLEGFPEGHTQFHLKKSLKA